LSLAGILFSLLFRFVVSYSQAETKLKNLIDYSAKKKILEERISWVLSNTEQASFDQSGFYTVKCPDDLQESLVVVFDAGIDPDPLFSQLVTGRIYLDKNKDFCFTYWSLDKSKARKEILYSNVDFIEWEFLTEKGRWLPIWPKGPKTPSMAKLKIYVQESLPKKTILEYAFILPNSIPIRMNKP
jgi:hypothetical protein